MEAAREDPSVAKQLYDFALYGCRTEVSVRRLRETFTELGIPLNFLSHAEDVVTLAGKWRGSVDGS